MRVDRRAFVRGGIDARAGGTWAACGRTAPNTARGLGRNAPQAAQTRPRRPLHVRPCPLQGDPRGRHVRPPGEGAPQCL